MSEHNDIQSVLTENRIFDPPAGFQEKLGGAWVESMEEYRDLHAKSIADPAGFWESVASNLQWFKPWDTVLEWNLPDARWFIGGTITIVIQAIAKLSHHRRGFRIIIIAIIC